MKSANQRFAYASKKSETSRSGGFVFVKLEFAELLAKELFDCVSKKETQFDD